MGRFDDLRSTERFQKLSPVDPQEAAQLAAKHPGIPSDYLEFLQELGAGMIGNAAFAVYAAPSPPKGVYDPDTARALGPLLLVSDDFQGYCYAFDPTRNWSIVEIDPTDKSVDVVAGTFEEYVRNFLAAE